MGLLIIPEAVRTYATLLLLSDKLYVLMILLSLQSIGGYKSSITTTRSATFKVGDEFFYFVRLWRAFG